MLERHAHLAAPTNVVFEAIANRGEKNGFDVERTETVLRVRAPLGNVYMEKNGSGIDVTLSADSPENMQLFVNLYAQRFAEAGLESALTWQAVTVKSPLNQILTKVVSVAQISPNFMRLRLSGDFLPFTKPGAGLHFRMLFNEGGLDWPSLDHRGITVWPNGAGNWHRPPYTVRKISPDADWIDVDIVLHEGGKVTDWCNSVVPGTELALHGPSGGSQPSASWLGLIGDETALPVIMHMIEKAPVGTKGQALILVRDPADAQPFETASDIQLVWGVMGDASDPAALIDQLNPPSEDFYLFFAGERSQANIARSAFKQLELSAKLCKAASYWTLEDK